MTDDFNTDGNPDLATANFYSANVSILLGDGTGGFGLATKYGVGTAPTSLMGGNEVSDTGAREEPEEEAVLARMAQAGDTKALDRLRLANLIMTREEAALRLGVS